MGMTDEEIESVLAVVSSILHMGNIGFEAGFKKQMFQKLDIFYA